VNGELVAPPPSNHTFTVSPGFVPVTCPRITR
jgi:hypothetical protein